MEGKQGLGGKTSFDFKYMPNPGQKTVTEDVDRVRRRKFGIEMLNLVALILGSVSIGIMALLGIKIGMGLVTVLAGRFWRMC